VTPTLAPLTAPAPDAARGLLMDLFVKDIRVDAAIGALAPEYGRRQLLLVDVDMRIEVPADDVLTDTVDYRAVAACAADLAVDHIVLIETYALRLARACLDLPSIRSVAVTVRKPAALAPAMAGTRVYLEN
jgi:dihydroneopterin aldolase